MLGIYLSIIGALFAPCLVQCDITNVKEFFNVLHQNSSKTYSIGFLSKANADVVKRYLRGNTKKVVFDHKEDMLNALDNETIIAVVTTGAVAEDVGSKYHVFSSLIISPQAMLLAPDYHSVLTPYGLRNTSSQHLFDALNAAVAGIQQEDTDETIFTAYNRTDMVRAYTCRQESQLPVVNRNDTTGYLRDILFNNVTLKIGSLGPFDWGVHDGNYKDNASGGIYPKLLQAVVNKLKQLKGPDGIVYGEGITFERKFYKDDYLLFRALLGGDVHATDVFLLTDVPYRGTNESCSNDSQCRARESCANGFCIYPERSRSLHFRTTCTIASRDTKFITKKDSHLFQKDTATTNNSKETPRQTPKTRWVGFLLLFAVLFGSIFLILLAVFRRKSNYCIQRTLPGGLGKFVRLQEESEPPMESLDSFDDRTVQSPRNTMIATS